MKATTKAKLELINYIDQEITTFIDLNNGARTKEDVLAVFNSTLLLLANLRSDFYDMAQAEEESFASTNIAVILGGIR